MKKIFKQLGELMTAEVQTITAHVADQFRPHNVNVGCTKYVAHDAKKLNNALNQSGRGDYRYLRETKTQEWCVAQHRDQGNGYRILGQI